MLSGKEEMVEASRVHLDDLRSSLNQQSAILRERFEEERMEETRARVSVEEARDGLREDLEDCEDELEMVRAESDELNERLALKDALLCDLEADMASREVEYKPNPKPKPNWRLIWHRGKWSTSLTLSLTLIGG